MRTERVGLLVVCPNVSAAVVKNRTRAIVNQCFHLITGLLVRAQTYGGEFNGKQCAGKKAGKLREF